MQLDSKSILLFLNQVGEDKWDLDGEYGGYLRSLFFWCSPDDFESALRIYSKVRGGEGKNIFLDAMFRRFLSTAGPSALTSAIQSIERTFGVGKLAEDARFSLFHSAGLSGDALRELAKVKNPSERVRLLGAMQFSLKYSQDLTSLNGLNIAGLAPDERSVLFAALAMRVGNSKGLGREFDDVLNECLSITNGSKEKSELLARCAAKSPYEVWKILSEKSLGIDDSAMQEARRASIVGIAKTNGELALSNVLELKPGAARTELLQLGVSSFLAANSVGAEEWLQKNEKRLGTVEIDSIEASMAQFAAKASDLDKANSYLQRIDDPEIKKRVEGQVWTAERDFLRGEVTKDPTGTMESIIDGQSKFGDYWLEEAMGTWISKDFDKAQAWYQDNWNKLPASKSQFLAAAFAKQAAGQGDVEAARQWAGYIQDPKTKQRIEAGIAKAEAAKNH